MSRSDRFSRHRLVLLVLFAAALAGLPAAPAAAGWWMLGRGHDDYAHLQVLPGEPTIVYAVRDGSLWRLSEADDTWRQVPVPTPTVTDSSGPEVVEYVPVGMQVTSVWVAPRDPRRIIVSFLGRLDVYADGYLVDGSDAGMLVGSDDGGATWTAYTAGPFTPVLAFVPSQPETVYATFFSLHRHPSDPYAARLEPGQGSFDQLANLEGDFFVAPFGFAVDANRPDHLLAFADGGKIFTSVDAGAHWTLGLTAPTAVTVLATHPTEASTALAGSEDGVLWTSTDGGFTWVQRAVLPTGGVTDLTFDPVDGQRYYAVAGGVPYASDDRGLTWQPITDGLPAGAVVRELAVDPADPTRLFATVVGEGLWRLDRRFPAVPCTPDETTLCLGSGGRFAVRVLRQDFDFASDHGQAVPLEAADTGAFWFFSEDNLELLVKVLDGRTVNGFHWVFYGASTNVPFTLVVTDTRNGDAVGYFNPAQRFASLGDTRAFPEGEPKTLPLPGDVTPPVASTEAPSVCVAGENVLCLAGGRFQVEVAWEDFTGGFGSGTAVPETDDSGFFWFFRPSNLELSVKILDGRRSSGHWWVFYGALTNVAFTLRVTDTQTGEVLTYANPSGNFASRGDTSAFAEAAP